MLLAVEVAVLLAVAAPWVVMQEEALTVAAQRVAHQEETAPVVVAMAVIMGRAVAAKERVVVEAAKKPAQFRV